MCYGPHMDETVIRKNGKKATEIIEMSEDVRNCKEFSRRVNARLMSREEFIEKHGSGTLRKSDRIGFKVKDHYLHERAHFEFGWGFECIPSSRVNWGDTISYPDCKVTTEIGWLVDRYAVISVFPGDEIEFKNIEVEFQDGERQSGPGIIIRKTSAKFIPEGHIVYCILSKIHNGNYGEVINPC